MVWILPLSCTRNPIKLRLKKRQNLTSQTLKNLLCVSQGYYYSVNVLLTGAGVQDLSWKRPKLKFGLQQVPVQESKIYLGKGPN